MVNILFKKSAKCATILLTKNNKIFMKKVIFFSLILFVASACVFQVNAATMAQTLKGKILLQVEEKGEAWYVNPTDAKRYYMGRPADAYSLMRSLGVGITNSDLTKIQVADVNLGGKDSDGDGLADSVELGFGTRIDSIDTDADGYDDKTEIINGYSPLTELQDKIIDLDFVEMNKGKIFLQVESLGEAWYINPDDGKRYFLGKPDDAFNIMRQLGLGISNQDLEQIVAHIELAKPDQNLDDMIAAAQDCSAYSLTKQSIIVGDAYTTTLDVDAEIINEANDGRCRYKYMKKNIVVSMDDDQKQFFRDDDYSEQEIEQVLQETQLMYDELYNNVTTYIKIGKTDLKEMLTKWDDRGYMVVEPEMDHDIYYVWLEGRTLPGVSSTGLGPYMNFKSVDGVDGTAVIELDGIEYTMEKDELVTVGDYEFMYLGTTVEENICTVNGQEQTCGDDWIYINYKYREL